MIALAETEKGTKEERGLKQKGQAPWIRYEDVSVEGSWPTLRQGTNGWVIFKAVNLI